MNNNINITNVITADISAIVNDWLTDSNAHRVYKKAPQKEFNGCRFINVAKRSIDTQ